MKKIILCGPIIGSFEWEFLYFAPHAIWLAKKHNMKLVIASQKDRVDLYGSYADHFIVLSNIDNSKSNGFGNDLIDVDSFFILRNLVNEKVKKGYNILTHIYPSVDGFLNKFRRQFPRDQMFYKFKPRESNEIYVKEKLLKNYSDDFYLLDLSWVEAKDTRIEIVNNFKRNLNDKKRIFIYDKENIYDSIEDVIFIDIDEITKIDSISTTGVFLSLINSPRCRFVGNLKSVYSKMAFSIKDEIFSFDDNFIEDDFNVINPENHKVRLYQNLFSGDLNENII